MANTTQDEEKSATEGNSASEEVRPPEKEIIESKGEEEVKEEVKEKVEVEKTKEKEEEKEKENEKEEGGEVEEGGGRGDGGDGGGGGGGGDGGGGEVKVEMEVREVVVEEAENNEEDEGGDFDEEDVVEEEEEEEEEVEEEEEEEGVDEEEEEEDEEGVTDTEEEKGHEEKMEKALDDDQDRRNPQYIPKGGAFYEHDNRTTLEDVENKDPLEVEKKKKVWKESKESERWLHDWYKESEQTPKSKAEIIQIYGYDIRKEEAPPRARRRRKYGRGPDKYDRNWEDEQAYMVKQNGPSKKGRKKNFGKEQFPPLPNQRKNEPSVEKPVGKYQSWKRSEEEPARNRIVKASNQEKPPMGGPPLNRNGITPQRTTAVGPYAEKRAPPPTIGRINEENIKPFRNEKNKWKNSNFRRGKQDEIPKPAKSKLSRQGEAQTPRSVDSNKNSSGESDVSHLTEGFSQMTFHNKHSSMRDRQDSNEANEQELDSPANRLNPKRYSKNRKSFTGFFPAEDIVDLDPAKIKQLQQEQQNTAHVNLPQQPLNIQSVMGGYPATFNGNPGYIAPGPIIQGIPNQGMSPQGLQQTLSPQGIPQQALSPQVPGLQPIELQQPPLPPASNFVPPIYIDIDPHYGTSDMMGAYTGYGPYSANQPNEMYQPSGGITYYNTECQNSNQIRPPPARRQKAAIPIVPPPE